MCNNAHVFCSLLVPIFVQVKHNDQRITANVLPTVDVILGLFGREMKIDKPTENDDSTSFN